MTILNKETVFDLANPQEPIIPVKVQLQYDDTDPYAVRAFFKSSLNGWVKWCWSRELMADGLIKYSGQGDVQIGPCPNDAKYTMIYLSSPTGNAVFQAESSFLASFLVDTFELVPAGSEVVTWDTSSVLGT